MIHLRIVASAALSERALELLEQQDTVLNIVHLHGVARNPDGDLILCDVVREEASVVIDDLVELGIPRDGSIAMEVVDTEISDAGERAERAAFGYAADAVVWEEVEEQTSENAELSASFIAFMVLATILAAVAVLTDSPVLLVGAMVVGPEFGPLAGICVAIVEGRRDLARRSLVALLVGFPVAIAVTYASVQALRTLSVAPETVASASRPLTQFISHPDAFSFVVAFLAGIAGVLSLTSAKSGALIGVLISVTTIPAAGNVAAAAAYANWPEATGALLQLGVNLCALVLAGVLTLWVQRQVFLRQRRRHRGDRARRLSLIHI